MTDDKPMFIGGVRVVPINDSETYGPCLGCGNDALRDKALVCAECRVLEAKANALPLAIEQIAKMLAGASEMRDDFLEDGLPALLRVIDIGLEYSGQSRICGRFLLGLFNGGDFPFDLTTLRGLDDDLADDCLEALRMDSRAVGEVHSLVPNGQAIFDQLLVKWATHDETKDWPEPLLPRWRAFRTDDN